MAPDLQKRISISTTLLFYVCKVCLLGIVHTATAQNKSLKLQKLKRNFISIPEPSDLCVNDSGNAMFIVSDAGMLFKTDLEGQVQAKADEKGDDFEGVCMADGLVYVSDESDRKIYVYNATDLSLKHVVDLPYKGETNKGFESICYNPKENKFILISESDPCKLFIYSKEFKLERFVTLKVASDISAANFYNNQLYVLSDEDHCLIALNDKFETEQKYDVAVINPEGLYITKEYIIVASDDMQCVYYFKNTLP